MLNGLKRKPANLTSILFMYWEKIFMYVRVTLFLFHSIDRIIPFSHQGGLVCCETITKL